MTIQELYNQLTRILKENPENGKLKIYGYLVDTDERLETDSAYIYFPPDIEGDVFDIDMYKVQQ